MGWPRLTGAIFRWGALQIILALGRWQSLLCWFLFSSCPLSLLGLCGLAVLIWPWQHLRVCGGDCFCCPSLIRGQMLRMTGFHGWKDGSWGAMKSFTKLKDLPKPGLVGKGRYCPIRGKPLSWKAKEPEKSWNRKAVGQAGCVCAVTPGYGQYMPLSAPGNARALG